MKKTMLAALSLALLAGCAAVPPKKPQNEIDQERLSAAKAFSSCVGANVAALDDGVSDASTIAFALTLRCNHEYDAALDALTDGLDSSAAQIEAFKTRAKSRDKLIEASLPLVLAYRNAQRMRASTSTEQPATPPAPVQAPDQVPTPVQ
jgi:uncharacterized lipoprotein YmbA